MPSNSKIILFILPTLNGGGAERVALNYLRRLDARRYALNLILFGKTEELADLITPDLKVINLNTNSTRKSFWPLLFCLQRIRPDIIFTTHSRIATLLFFIRPLVPKFRHLARLQNTPSAEKKFNVYGRGYRLLYSLAFRSADIVIAQTDNMRKDAITTFRISEKKIFTRHNPIDINLMKSSVNNAQAPFNTDQITAVGAGRTTYQKGFDLLIRSIPKVLQIYPNFHLYILGKIGIQGKDLFKIVADLNLGKHISFKGYQKNPYIYYSNCDLFILSSRWEGFPNVFLENYYLNTPIVATKCVPIVEHMIRNGNNGYVCEINDVKDLSDKIIKCIKIKRNSIQNDPIAYEGLDDLF